MGVTYLVAPATFPQLPMHEDIANQVATGLHESLQPTVFKARPLNSVNIIFVRLEHLLTTDRKVP